MDSETRIARKLAALAGMGFSRVESPPLGGPHLHASEELPGVTTLGPCLEAVLGHGVLLCAHLNGLVAGA